MIPQYVLSPKLTIAAARCRQAMMHAFFGAGLFCLLANSARAQNISPEARQLFQQADSARRNQKINLLESALRLSPQYLEARLELAKTLMQAKEFRRAIFQLDTVLSKNIKNAEAWFYKGRAHAEIGENNIAQKSFAQALVLYLELGKTQLANQSFDAALQSFERSIEIAISTKDSARQAEAWFGKGLAHEAQGDTANAAKSYRQSLRAQPDFKEAGSALTNLENQSRPRTLADSAKTPPIEPAVQFAENKSAAAESVATKKKLPPPEKNTRTTFKQDSVSKRSLIAPLDSTNRQPVQPIAEKASSTSTLEWIAAFVAALGIVILALVLIRKYWKKPQPPPSTATVTIPLPTEPSQPASMREAIKVIMDKQLQATPLPANIIHPEFERFPLERLLGLGGMGRVYKAYDRKLKRPVALKVIINRENLVDQSQFGELLKRFQREAQNTAQLSHPNIVNLYEFYDERDGEFFMTMEYIEGATVMQLLQEKKRLAINDAVAIIRQACEALEYAHKKNVIHRDLKPSNIMLNLEATVKVVDFGIAKILSSQESPFTETGFRIGTLEYMSPEQLNAEALDRCTDIFSLGLVFYQMLAGELPPKEVRRGKPVPKLCAIDRSIPGRIDAIVAKMLAPDREQRYPNAAEIIEALKSFGATV